MRKIYHRYPLEPSSLQAKVDYISRDSQVYRAGLYGDACVVLTAGTHKNPVQFERITYLRYQLVYLGKVYGGYRRSGTTDWWLPQQHIGDDTISHLCGDNRCIAPSHLIAEPLSDNQGREDCFLVIREWIDDHP